MEFLILLIICTSTVFSGIVPESVKFTAEDARVRRDSVSYSTSVIHDNPRYPDQHAESSIKVDFQTNQQVKKPAIKRPKTSSDQIPLQQTFVPQKVDRYQQDNNQFNTPQSQSFNVGYSVRFNDKPSKFPQQTFQNTDIITGSRNNAVQKPNDDFDAQEFVNNALIDIKKQKISGIKPKYNKHYVKDDTKNFISNLAPKTQQYLSYLGEPKPVASSNTRFRQHLLPKVKPLTESLTSSWTNLSPTVEIYHSKDLLQNNLKQGARHFNHNSALGKTEEFDFSNVLEALNGNNNNNLYNNLKTTEETLIPLAHKANINPYTPLQILSAKQIQFPQSPSESIQTHTVQKHNLPVDTSLLRDPVLTVSNKNVAANEHTLPIQFDTTLLEAMQQKLNSNQDITKEHRQNNLENVQMHTPLGMHHIHLNGNSQPTFVLNNENFDQYFNRYLESIQPQETQVKHLVIPFQGGNFHPLSNAAKDIEIDLRPPPININRTSRLFSG
ncbi:hypothetical protein RN001_003002 [Aquatica leii]|uniref:Uncharacterized protein n=1 Tax=Aquatica leii TaxID=1421715 RepID=A0AAN7PQK5_9COLE|nr:hypothetical protein RN001_003002 [Aquatica leii]